MARPSTAPRHGACSCSSPASTRFARAATTEHMHRETRDMDEMTFQQKMTEIMNRIRELPEPERERGTVAGEAVGQRRERITKSVAELQESLDYLRLSVKYLIFDLEATRREN